MTELMPSIGPAVITLGVFDGVHLGHRHLIASTAAAARERDARSVALVFDPPPIEIIRPGVRVRRLLPVDLVLERLGAAGSDRVVPLRFDSAMREMTPAEFLAALASGIELRGVAMTADSAFGRDRAGTLEHVASIGAQRGFDVIEVAALELDGAPVSSSRIREALAAGEVPLATRLLGVEPLLRGTVVHGEGRGRRLGFPTANLSFEYLAALPARGIYLGHVDVPAADVGPEHPALVSVGVRPTFHEHADELVEVYLLDWEGDLYGMALSLQLGPRLRGERRFESVEALIEQMRADEADARHRFASA